MLLALGTTAFAVENNDGSITITNATVGKNYSIYKVFDLTYDDSNADDVKVAYTYTPTDAEDAFLTALEGVSSPFTLTDQNSGKYTVTLKADKTAVSVPMWGTFLSEPLLIVALLFCDQRGWHGAHH